MKEPTAAALSPFLVDDAIITSKHPVIRKLVRQLVPAETNPARTATSLFEWVRDSIAYDVASPFFLPEHYQPEFIIERRRGFCIPKAVLLAALARAAGIPARLVFADIVNHQTPAELRQQLGSNIFVYHCYNELWLDGRWVKVVCSFDAALCARHGFPLVEFDGRHDALFPTHDASGKPFIEYVRHHGPRADLPLAEVLAAWQRVYGSARVQQWRRLLEQAGF